MTTATLLPNWKAQAHLSTAQPAAVVVDVYRLEHVDCFAWPGHGPAFLPKGCDHDHFDTPAYGFVGPPPSSDGIPYEALAEGGVCGVLDQQVDLWWGYDWYEQDNFTSKDRTLKEGWGFVHYEVPFRQGVLR